MRHPRVRAVPVAPAEVRGARGAGVRLISSEVETDMDKQTVVVDQPTVAIRPRVRLSGPPSLFRGKVRAPVSLTLTPGHHEKVNRNMRRLDLTRADFIGLLIEKYADRVELWPLEKQREVLRLVGDERVD